MLGTPCERRARRRPRRPVSRCGRLRGPARSHGRGSPGSTRRMRSSPATGLSPAATARAMQIGHDRELRPHAFLTSANLRRKPVVAAQYAREETDHTEDEQRRDASTADAPHQRRAHRGAGEPATPQITCRTRNSSTVVAEPSRTKTPPHAGRPTEDPTDGSSRGPQHRPEDRIERSRSHRDIDVRVDVAHVGKPPAAPVPDDGLDASRTRQHDAQSRACRRQPHRSPGCGHPSTRRSVGRRPIQSMSR